MSDDGTLTSRRSVDRMREAGASRKTVIIALTANAVIAVTKLAGGLISGSTALLAEAAHSLADTANQSFLLVSIALAKREPDADQPFGHGRQRYVWTFLAAVSMFVAGATFAVGYGIVELVAGGESSGGFLVAWITLAIALLAEGASWIRAVRQTRGEAKEAGRPWLKHVRNSRDPSVKMVLFEDSAALLGVLIACAGIGLHQLTGQPYWDAGASVAIGLLLIGVAIWMGTDTGRLLTGAAARPDEREQIGRVLEDDPGVVEVVELLTMVLGPNALLVAARLDVDDDLDGAGVEQAATRLDRKLRDALPDVTEVFLDATPASARERQA
ncbi:MAG TPA: cation diffusion facilitator family transporter [Solirubrobacter sp.]|nr:cation diffusion facilitator family transporter [Solirubrobacter sp.]